MNKRGLYLYNVDVVATAEEKTKLKICLFLRIVLIQILIREGSFFFQIYMMLYVGKREREVRSRIRYSFRMIKCVWA